MNKISLIPYLEICCQGLNTKAVEIKDKLLTEDNTRDILSGDIPVITLKAHIQVWIDSGKQRINSGKKLGVTQCHSMKVFLL